MSTPALRALPLVKHAPCRPVFFAGRPGTQSRPGADWHIQGTLPRTNQLFWKNKLHRNRQRDKLVRRELQNLGWRVVRIWQHDLARAEGVARKVIAALESDHPRPAPLPHVGTVSGGIQAARHAEIKFGEAGPARKGRGSSVTFGSPGPAKTVRADRFHHAGVLQCADLSSSRL
jgi:hypothetical protein